MTQETLIRLKQVLEMTKASKSFIYNGMKKGTFPQNFKIGARASAWKMSQVIKWMDEQAKEVA